MREWQVWSDLAILLRRSEPALMAQFGLSGAPIPGRQDAIASFRVGECRRWRGRRANKALSGCNSKSAVASAPGAIFNAGVTEPALKRDIGFLGATFVALNGVIGAGIFAIPATLVASIGVFSPYLFLIFGALMLAIAVVFAELAKLSDETGGPIVYASAAFGGLAGFQAGWLLYIARVAALAANANVLVTYAAAFAPGLDEGVLRIGALLLLLAVTAGVNVLGVKQAIGTLNILTVLKITPLVLLSVGGLIVFFPNIAAPPAPPSLADLGGVSLLLLYAFVGFEAATMTSGETKEAKRTIPRALIGTIIAMTLLYFLVQLSYVAITRGEPVEGAPLAAAARVLAGPAGVVVMTLAALFSIGGNLASSMLSTPRLPFALAAARSLPPWFGKVEARWATPANAILFTGLLAGALAVSGAFVWLAIVSSLSRMFVYLLCAGALPVLKRREGKLTPKTLIAPLLAAALCIFAIAQAKADAWILLGCLAFVGVVLHAVASRSTTKSTFVS